MSDKPLDIIKISEITLTYGIDDDGHIYNLMNHKGDGNKKILLGMLAMAQDTILSPEYEEKYKE